MGSHPLQGVLLVDLVFSIILGPLLLLVAVFAFGNLAEQMSRRVGLALPGALRSTLNRFLQIRRASYLLGLLVLSQLYLALTWLASGSHRTGHIVELALLPVSVWIPCLLTSVWPRWRSRAREPHPHRLSVRDALLDQEWIMVAAAYAAAGGFITWSFFRAGLAPWSVLAVVLLACQALLTYAIARGVMTAPAGGGDLLELAWDDVLRLQRVRSLAASSSFVTLFFVVAAGGDLANLAMFSTNAFLIPVIAVTVTGVVAWTRSPANRNWRSAWPTLPSPSGSE